MLFLILLVPLGFLLYKYLTLNAGRFRECGVAYEPPLPLLGNLRDVFMGRLSYSENLHEHYRRFKGEKIFGFFNMRTPTFILRDISLINFVFKTEASKVVDRGLYVDTDDPLSMNLFYMEGQLWKKSREKLRPAFKSKNLKNLLPSFEKASKDLIEEVAEEGGSIDVKKHASRFSTRVITDPVLGLQLSRDEVDTFIHHIEELFRIDGFQGIKVLFRVFWPQLATMLGVRVARKSTEDLFVGLVEKQAENRRIEHFANYINSLREHYAVKEGKDSSFLDGLVIGQFFIFVLAGFETTSTTLTFALYLLSRNPEIHQRMRDEIQSVLQENDQQWNYETLKSLKLVKNVIFETLRLYPPVTGMLRIVSSEIKIPDTDIVIQPGEAVAACFTGVHKDPELFPDPEKFLPDRFDSPIPEGAFLPFGAGPRICIGKDLAMLELEMALSHIVMNFDLELDTQKTPSKLEVDPNNLFYSLKSGIWIKFKKISQ